MKKTYKEIKSDMNIWLPATKEDSLIGSVIEIREGQYGNQWVIKTEEEEIFLTPSHKVLQNRLSNIKIGDDIKIVYEGTEPPKIKGQNPTSMYKVYLAD